MTNPLLIKLEYLSEKQILVQQKMKTLKLLFSNSQKGRNFEYFVWYPKYNVLIHVLKSQVHWKMFYITKKSHTLTNAICYREKTKLFL